MSGTPRPLRGLIRACTLSTENLQALRHARDPVVRSIGAMVSPWAGRPAVEDLPQGVALGGGGWLVALRRRCRVSRSRLLAFGVTESALDVAVKGIVEVA